MKTSQVAILFILLLIGCSSNEQPNNYYSEKMKESPMLKLIPKFNESHDILSIPDVGMALEYPDSFSLSAINIDQQFSLGKKITKPGLPAQEHIYNIRFPFENSGYLQDIRIANDLPKILTANTSRSAIGRLCTILENPTYYSRAIIVNCKEVPGYFGGVYFLYAERMTGGKYARPLRIVIVPTGSSKRPGILIDTLVEGIQKTAFDEEEIRTTLAEIIAKTEKSAELLGLEAIIGGFKGVEIPATTCSGLGRCDINIDKNALTVTTLRGNDPSNLPIKDSAFSIIGTANKRVNAIEVYSSCNNENYRLKNFKPGSGVWQYNVGASIGNLCVGANNYIVRGYATSGATLLADDLLDEEPVHLTSEYNDPQKTPSWF